MHEFGANSTHFYLIWEERKISYPTNGSLLAMLLLHTTFNLSMFTFPVLDTNLGYAYVLGFFAVPAAVVTGIFGIGNLRQKP